MLSALPNLFFIRCANSLGFETIVLKETEAVLVYTNKYTSLRLDQFRPTASVCEAVKYNIDISCSSRFWRENHVQEPSICLA